MHQNAALCGNGLIKDIYSVKVLIKDFCMLMQGFNNKLSLIHKGKKRKNFFFHFQFSNILICVCNLLITLFLLILLKKKNNLKYKEIVE